MNNNNNNNNDRVLDAGEAYIFTSLLKEKVKYLEDKIKEYDLTNDTSVLSYRDLLQKMLDKRC